MKVRMPVRTDGQQCIDLLTRSSHASAAAQLLMRCAMVEHLMHCGRDRKQKGQGHVVNRRCTCAPTDSRGRDKRMAKLVPKQKDHFLTCIELAQSFTAVQYRLSRRQNIVVASRIHTVQVSSPQTRTGALRYGTICSAVLCSVPAGVPAGFGVCSGTHL